MRHALAVLALLLLPSAPLAAEEGFPTLKVNPMKKGLEGWERTGSDKAFAWDSAEAVLAVKGQSGKEPPRILYSRIAWEAGEFRFQAKKGARKVRVVLLPVPGGKPVALEFPSSAVKSAAWTELGVALRAGKAVLLAPGADGKEAEVASAAIPAGSACRFGFEAPGGTDAVLTGIRFERPYEDLPPVAEEGFESVFDGKSLGSWRAMNPADAPMFSADQGLIQGTARMEGGWLTFGGRTWSAYELRMRAYWGTTYLLVRAVEFPGEGGKINQLETVQVNLGDYIDPENLNEISVRVAGGTCAIVVNGKKVLDTKVKPFEATPVSFMVAPGKKFFLRDIRVRDLAAEGAK